MVFNFKSLMVWHKSQTPNSNHLFPTEPCPVLPHPSISFCVLITCPAASSFRSRAQRTLFCEYQSPWRGLVGLDPHEISASECWQLSGPPVGYLFMSPRSLPLTCYHSLQILYSLIPQNRAYWMCQRSSLLASCSSHSVFPKLAKFTL